MKKSQIKADIVEIITLHNITEVRVKEFTRQYRINGVTCELEFISGTIGVKSEDIMSIDIDDLQSEIAEKLRAEITSGEVAGSSILSFFPKNFKVTDQYNEVVEPLGWYEVEDSSDS